MSNTLTHTLTDTACPHGLSQRDLPGVHSTPWRSALRRACGTAAARRETRAAGRPAWGGARWGVTAWCRGRGGPVRLGAPKQTWLAREYGVALSLRPADVAWSDHQAPLQQQASGGAHEAVPGPGRVACPSGGQKVARHTRAPVRGAAWAPHMPRGGWQQGAPRATSGVVAADCRWFSAAAGVSKQGEAPTNGYKGSGRSPARCCFGGGCVYGEAGDGGNGGQAVWWDGGRWGAGLL